ncbi:hypothetical protein JTB14_018176 [Gonioctena quinquepunctata]|nr:hypothetical protein JTB14_018176 [Gonioctena quinquepunctata]
MQSSYPNYYMETPLSPNVGTGEDDLSVPTGSQKAIRRAGSGESRSLKPPDGYPKRNLFQVKSVCPSISAQPPTRERSDSQSTDISSVSTKIKISSSSEYSEGDK